MYNNNNYITKRVVAFLLVVLFFQLGLFIPQQSQAWIILTSLTVTVLDKDSNQPIPNAKVEINNPLYGKISGFTHENGIWQIPLVGGCGHKYSITVSKDGYKQFNHPPVMVPCFSNTKVTIKLEKESENTINPVLIIPGIAGTELFYQGEEIWMNMNKMSIDTDDDFLQVLTMDKNGNSINNIQKGNIIKQKILIFTIWSRLINDLKNANYIKNQTLFTFPYDWRRDNTYTASLLNNTINNILSTTGADKINIIAHSMGGLIVKQYLKNFGENKINKIFFLGTPHYGAPKALKTLLFGDTFGIPLILGPEAVKKITSNMPSVYQLLPSSLFFNNYNSYLIDFGDADQNGIVGSLDWNETNDFIQNMGLNGYLNNSAILFHQNIDNWQPSTSLQNRIYNIVGCDRPTLTRLISSINLKGEVKRQTWLTNGDETVPLKSALGSITNQNYFITEAKHSRLPDHPQIRKLIIDILQNHNPNIESPEYSNISTSPLNCGFNGILQSVHSPVAVHAYDQNGNHTGPNEQGGIDTNIPGSDYFELGEDKFIYIPEGIGVNFVYQGLAEGNWQLDLQKFEQGEIVTKATFPSLPTTPQMQGNMTINPAVDFSDILIKLNLNDNGQIDKTFSPANVLTGEKAADITPPIIIILSPQNNKLYLNDKIININYQIEEYESGLDSVILKLNKQRIIKQSIDLSMLSLQNHNLTIIAIDKAGNTSKKSIQFNTYTSLTALRNNIRHYWQKGLITKYQTYKKMDKILDKIEKAINKYQHKQNKKTNKKQKYQNKLKSEMRKRFNQLIHVVNKEKDKTIEENIADILIEQINFLLSTYK